MSDFVFATTTVDTSIPVVAVVFTLNNLIFDEPDPVDSMTVTVDLVSNSPVIDDTGAFVYGWPRVGSSNNANQVTVIPLPATKDASEGGNHLRNLAGTDVHYTLTVTGTKNGETIRFVTNRPFDVDAATPNGTQFGELTAQPSAPFIQPLSAAAQTAVDAYIDQLIGLGAITGPAGPEGDSAYDVAVAGGFVGNETDWLNSLVGPAGTTGATGPQGPQGPQGPEGPAADASTLPVNGGANLSATALNPALAELANRVTAEENETGDVPFTVAPAPTGGDDSSTLQTWIDTFPATGIEAYISGDYQLSDGLVINDHNVTFRGAGAGQANDATHTNATGARFTAIAGGNLATGTPMLQVQLAGNTQPVHNVRLERFSLDGANIATGDGIHYRSYRGVIDDVKVYRCAGAGIRAEGYVGWDLYESLIHKTEVADCAHGLYFDEGATDMHVTNCILYDNNINWELAGGGSVQASGCHLYNAAVDNLFFNGAGSRSKFWGFKIEGAGRHGVNIDSTVSGYSDIQFSACNITSNTDTSTINTVDSFIIKGPSGNGVTRTNINGCNFSTKSATQGNNPRYFVYLNTCAQDTLITGCEFGPASHYGTAPVGGSFTALKDSTITGNRGSNIETGNGYAILDRSFAGGTFGSGTDATAHVQSKIDELVTAGGGALAIPADSTFRITAPLAVESSNITIFGFGDTSTLLMDDDDTAGPNASPFDAAGSGGLGLLSCYDPADWNGSPAYSNLVFKDFRILGPNSVPLIDNWQSAGIDFGNDITDTIITNMVFENMRGFSAHARGNGQRITVNNNRMINNGNGLNINTDESTFTGNVCVATEGFELAGAGLTVTGNTLRDCGRDLGAVISVGGKIGGGAYYPASVIANNTLRDCTAGIIVADAADDCKIIGNTINGTVGNGIQAGAFSITAGNEPHGVSIENNTLRNIGGAAAPAGAAIGIWCYATDNVRITGNTMLRTDGNDADTDHGIYVWDCTNPIITENSIDATTYCFFLRDSTDILYRGNDILGGALQETGTVTYRSRGSYLTPNTVTARSFNSNNVTLEQLADVVATVITDTDDIRNEPQDLVAELTALGATAWYSFQDITTGTEQVLPNRVNGGAANLTRGATTGAEASDPVFAAATAMSFDGTDDFLLLPASDEPSFTNTTGSYSALIYAAVPSTSATTKHIWGAGTDGNNGLSMYLQSGTNLFVRARNAGTVTDSSRPTAVNDGQPRLFAGIAAEGLLKAYVSGQGLASGTAIAESPGASFEPPRIGSHGGGGSYLKFKVMDVIVFDGVALTETQLDDLADSLALYRPARAASGVTAARPIGTVIGYEYYDTTLGKPIWHDGAEVWVDATGTTA